MAGLTPTSAPRAQWARWSLVLALMALGTSGALYFVYREWTWAVRLSLALALVALGLSLLFDPSWPRQLWVRRATQYSVHTLLSLLAFTGLLTLINLLPYWFPQRWDWTQDQRNTLAPEIQQLLQSLSQPVTAYAFFTPQNDPTPVQELLETFVYYSNGRFRYEIVDPLLRPGLAQQYGITRDGTLVLVTDERYEAVLFPTEEEIAKALIRLLYPEQRVVVFLQGHGERDPQDSGPQGYALWRQELAGKNYQVIALDLAVEGYRLPENTRVVVVADPQQPLQAQELQVLQDFLAQGGALVLLLNPSVEGSQALSPGLTALLEERWGIRVQNTVVVDASSPQPGIALAAQYGQHPITERLQGWRTFFPLARHLELLETASPVNLVPLVMTSPRSWGETDLAALSQTGGNVRFDPEVDVQGPLVLAAAGEDESTGARLVVVGDADFASNAYYGELGNGLLALNLIDWTAEQEALLNIAPRNRIERQFNPPTALVFNLLVLTTVCLMPLGVVVLGMGIWAYRRWRG